MGLRVEKQSWLGVGGRGSLLACILHTSEFLGTSTRGHGSGMWKVSWCML